MFELKCDADPLIFAVPREMRQCLLSDGQLCESW